MSKKRLYFIVAITAIITFGFFLAAYIVSQQGNNSDNTIEQKSPFGNFFPFGKGSPETNTNPSNNSTVNGGGTVGTTGSDTQLDNGQKNFPPLRQISPTATAGMFSSVSMGKTMVRFIERATGNIFETTMEDMQKNRISNAIIPRTEEVFFGNGGKSAVYRYIKDGGSSIETFVRTVPNPDRSKIEAADATTTNPLIGSFLEENALNVLVSPDSKTMFYLTKTPDFNTHTSVGSVYDFQKNTSQRVFSSPFAEWLPVYFNGKTAVLQTKASQNVPGYLYSMDTSSGELQKIIGGINGLTALPSPDLQKVLYSESTRGGVTLHLYDRKSSKTLDIALVTLPEKCVWNVDSTAIYCAAPVYIPTAAYPDAWYQGSVSFNDSVWKIDSKTGNVSSVFSSGSFSSPKMDMENLMISPNRDFLFFINKVDSTLWGYSLSY